MKDFVPDFKLGESYAGTDTDGNLLNSPLVGRTYEFEITEDIAAAMNMSKRSIGMRVKARIFRNTLGSALAAGDVAIVAATGGAAGLGTTTAKSSANSRLCHVVDPALPSSGVADDDLYLGIIEGPTKAKLASGVTLTGGELARADTGGVMTHAVSASDADDKITGTWLEAGTGDGSTLFELDMHPTWS